MKVELLVSEWCASCHDAERVWREVAEDRAIDFAVVDMGQPEGRALASRLRIRSIPAVIIDGELKHIGLLGKAAALDLVADAPERTRKTTQHVGLGLSGPSRAAILGAMFWLLVAGGVLPLGGLFLEGAARPAALHAFTLGFLLLLIMGLGEHMLPRFTGHPIAGGWLWAWTPQVLVHLAILVLGAGWLLGAAVTGIAGAAAALLALVLFAIRVVPLLVRPSL
ncbi:MAG: thioredoxin family protein [Pseudomonadota bacterium]